MRPSFYEQSYEQIQDLLSAQGLSRSGADLLYWWHYRENRTEPCREDLALKTQRYLEENFSFDLPVIEQAHESQDRTVKFLMRMRDGQKVETVLLPFFKKYTICLSTQVGCAMQCSFCFTGTQGLKRHLSADEIVGQFMEASRWLAQNRPGDPRVLNIVFMGQGEPLHNFDSVKKATQIFLAKRGTALAALRVTISTAGYLPGLKRWAEEMPGVNIALSLHSVFEEKRNKLIPINQRFPLSEVMHYLDNIPLKRKQFVTYEYLLIKDYNDSDEDAHATGKFLKGKTAIVNLIPFNPFPGSQYKRSEMERVLEFQKIMTQYELPTMIRSTKGDDILAACGQLKTT